MVLATEMKQHFALVGAFSSKILPSRRFGSRNSGGRRTPDLNSFEHTVSQESLSPVHNTTSAHKDSTHSDGATTTVKESSSSPIVRAVSSIDHPQSAAGDALPTGNGGDDASRPLGSLRRRASMLMKPHGPSRMSSSDGQAVSSVSRGSQRPALDRPPPSTRTIGRRVSTESKSVRNLLLSQHASEVLQDDMMAWDEEAQALILKVRVPWHILTFPGK